ncbi:hypothetical protein [Haloarcula pelagica]|uniref:hypothetical protein n=1 Tax=Haloarcula pelagica TaxID=3033389 RepID=UPI0024C430EA|nr:hypothetical protein [Halomicroarcula sp. YJ-61-S]
MERTLMSPRYSRRAFLAGVTGSSLALAGCASRDVGEPTSPSFESVVSDVTVGSRDLVVELSSDDVTEAVLIGPDGTAFDSQPVEAGVRTVRFQIIEFEPGFNTSSHYTPGLYELVVVIDGTELKKELSIIPDIRLTGVRQYREYDSPADLARIVFTVDNNGTGPTWIYDATFEDAPNYTANDDPIDNASIPYVDLLSSKDKFIVGPGENQSYLNNSKPLAFPEVGHSCERQPRPFRMQIGIADGSTIETVLTPTCGGEKISLDLVDRVVYSRTEIEWEQSERNS